jgi:hypothetical protein
MLDRMGWDNRVGRAVATYGVSARGDGYVVPIIAKTDFSFDGRAGGTTQDIPLAVGIDSSAWVSGVLVVRIHARNTWTGTATLSALVENIMLAPEEPDVIFAASTPVASSTALGTTTPPGLILQAFAAPIGPMLRVRLNYVVTVAQSAANTISLGIDLLGRPA